MDVFSTTVFKITRDQANRLREMRIEEICKIFNVSPETIQRVGRDRFLASIDYEVMEN